MDRITPPRCEDCGRDPWVCESCNDYQCACPLPWMLLLKKRPKFMLRVHYDKMGNPYGPPKDLILQYPDADDDIKWLIESEYA